MAESPPAPAARSRKPRPRLLTVMTVRQRLVLGLLGLLVVVVVVLAVAEVLVVRHVLYQRTAQGLRTELQLLAATASSSPTPASTSSTPASCGELDLGAGLRPPGPKGPGPRGRPNGPTIGPAGATTLAQVLAQRGIASALVGPRGTVLACATAARSGPGSGLRLLPDVVRELLASGPGGGYATFRASGHHLLAIAQPVGADTDVIAADLSTDDAAVATVLVVAGLASRPLLRSVLAPLRTVAGTADAIAGGDLDQRAELARTPDEVGHLGMAFDRMVDRLQEALAERDDLVARLRAHEQTMRRFLADASHELRTPLTAIRGGTQVLRLGAATDPEELAESLAHIQAQAERMSRLVADLLLLSRQEAGPPERSKELVDLGALIKAERAHWAMLCGDHPLVLETNKAWVHGDRDALLRVCANLVANAATYSPTGSPIEVVVSGVEDRVELVVADRGIGIPAGERSKVFERFYRGDPARARATGGTGLGLAIVASTAADHGGWARAEENPGGGARLVVTLPLAGPKRTQPS
jgi:signal transduction histidine kinase